MSAYNLRVACFRNICFFTLGSFISVHLFTSPSFVDARARVFQASNVRLFDFLHISFHA